MGLTPGQRYRIRQLLEAELRTECRAALDRGVRPAVVADVLTTRLRALEELTTVLLDDPEHPVDDVREPDGIGEQC
jgi:hypothetical protein